MRIPQLTPFVLAVIVFAASLQAANTSAQPSPANNQDPILSQPFLDNRHLFKEAAPGIAASTVAADASAKNYGVKRGRNIDINIGVLKAGQVGAAAADQGSPSDNRKIVLNLFEDANLIAVVDKVDYTDKGINWIGKVEGSPKSSVILVERDGVIAGNVRYLGKYYEIRYSPSGTHTVKEINQDELPDEVPPVVASPDAVSAADSDPFVGGPTQGDTGAQIDVLILYTPAARVAAGGVSSIEAIANLSIIETNQSYANSGITTSLNMVHVAEISYTEAPGNFSLDLQRLADPFDGIMNEAHTYRDIFAADVVALLTNNTGSCGIAYVLQALDPAYESLAFSVTDWTCATGNYTFGHEIGHNQGCAHDIANAGVMGLDVYSYGYQEPTGNFRTVMAYDCPGSCPRVQHFSNPNVNYFGQPTGITGAADNALTINTTANLIANYRDSSTASVLPEILSPTPESTLSQSDPTFTWNVTTVVDRYWLYVSTFPGGQDIFDSGDLGTATSVTAQNIPLNGNDVYVRLWYEVNSVWSFVDYLYHTINIPPSPPVLQTPAPGSTLTASPTVFTWSAGSGATQYWFTLGSSPGAADIASQGSGLNTSTSAPVVLDGNDVWAEVWMNTSGGWVSDGPVQYSTIDVPTGGAVIQSPAPGSTLSSTPVTFSWDAGTGALQYWFLLGTTPGGGDLASVGKGLSTSHAVSFPLNGNPVYAEVWTELPTGWVSEGPVQYDTANSLPQITSPAPGSTITTSQVTFSWTATPGVSQYWFLLGTTPGGTQYASVGTGTNTSTTVGLNLTGNPVYAEVWVQIGTQWFSAGPVQYDTANNPNGPGVIQSPAPGSQINSSPVQISWTPGSGVLEHWLIVGTTSGGANIYSASTGTGTSASVSVPLTGQTIYAEVWSNVAGTWESDGPVQYTTVNNLPAVQSPAPGSTLTSSPATFTWSAGQGVTQNWITLGTTSGGGQLYNAGHNPGNNQATINVPLNGNPVYFQIYSNVGGTWLTNGPVQYQTQ